MTLDSSNCNENLQIFLKLRESGTRTHILIGHPYMSQSDIAFEIRIAWIIEQEVRRIWSWICNIVSWSYESCFSCTFPLSLFCSSFCDFFYIVWLHCGPLICAALTPELKTTIDKVVTSNKVVLFMKGTKDFPQCGFSNTVVQILKSLNLPFQIINILENEVLCQAMKEYSSWPTFPQLYVDGEFFGGCDITVGESSSLATALCWSWWSSHVVFLLWVIS